MGWPQRQLIAILVQLILPWLRDNEGGVKLERAGKPGQRSRARQVFDNRLNCLFSAFIANGRTVLQLEVLQYD